MVIALAVCEPKRTEIDFKTNRGLNACFAKRRTKCFMCAGFGECTGHQTTEKEKAPTRSAFDSLGAYRKCGILPCEEMRVALNKRRNAICKHHPERQASTGICYSSDDTTNNAVYRQRRYANPSVRWRISKRTTA